MSSYDWKRYLPWDIIKVLIVLSALSSNFNYITANKDGLTIIELIFQQIVGWGFFIGLWKLITGFYRMAIVEFTIQTIQCPHCHYEWQPRRPHNTTTNLPAQCPKCQRKIS
jgi:hypothetical protein